MEEVSSMKKITVLFYIRLEVIHSGWSSWFIYKADKKEHVPERATRILKELKLYNVMTEKNI